MEGAKRFGENRLPQRARRNTELGLQNVSAQRGVSGYDFSRAVRIQEEFGYSETWQCHVRYVQISP